MTHFKALGTPDKGYLLNAYYTEAKSAAKACKKVVEAGDEVIMVRRAWDIVEPSDALLERLRNGLRGNLRYAGNSDYVEHMLRAPYFNTHTNWHMRPDFHALISDLGDVVETVYGDGCTLPELGHESREVHTRKTQHGSLAMRGDNTAKWGVRIECVSPAQTTEDATLWARDFADMFVPEDQFDPDSVFNPDGDALIDELSRRFISTLNMLR